MRSVRKPPEAPHAWGLKDIRALLDLLIEREITEFEMEKDGFRVRVRRGGVPEIAPAATVVPLAAAPAPAITHPPAAAPAPREPVAESAPPTPAAQPPAPPAAESTEGLHIIKSPIVGTFYRASSPEAEPFVKEGDMVEVGQVLCVIEAMKLMNEIESEVAGEVVRIYVENAQPVEYGQPLFAIRPR
jgi:acetyl-CoA carboxylase biotin carboxyl carrier protein